MLLCLSVNLERHFVSFVPILPLRFVTMINGFFGFSSFNTEQKIDGNALKLLAREGNTTQYAACRLTTVGDQMHLKEMISGLTLPLVPVLSRHRKKPTITEIKTLTELNQRIYKAK